MLLQKGSEHITCEEWELNTQSAELKEGVGWESHVDKMCRTKIKFGKGCKLLPQVLIQGKCLFLKQVILQLSPTEGGAFPGSISCWPEWASSSWDDPICHIHHCSPLLSGMHRALTCSIKSLHAGGWIPVTLYSWSWINAFFRVGGMKLSKKHCKNAERITCKYPVCSAQYLRTHQCRCPDELLRAYIFHISLPENIIWWHVIKRVFF